MLAFNDIYRMLAGLAIVMAPAFLLLRGAPKAPASAPVH